MFVNVNKKVLAVLMLSGFASCSFVKTEAPRPSPMADVSTGMPDFHIIGNYKITKKTTKGEERKPAAVDPVATSKDGEDPSINAFSNRKIYFLALLSQYYELKSLGKIESPEVTICPSFHTDVVNNVQIIKKSTKHTLDFSQLKYDFSKVISKEADYLSLYPELSLPLTSDHSHPAVADGINEKTSGKFPEFFKTGYSVHVAKTYKELSDLCEKGQTDNYYVFENLMTYFKSHPDFKDDSKAMKAILKSTIFANMALIKSLNMQIEQERKVASLENKVDYNSFEEEILSRLEASWVRNYFETMKMRRVAGKK